MRIESFSTDRYLIADWAPLVNDAKTRTVLEAELAAILTAPVLKHLPPALQLAEGKGAVPSWIAAREAESDVLAVHSKSDNRLTGLIVLAPGPDDGGRACVHIGYLIAEDVWGRGVATELLTGLVSAMRVRAPVRLVGGVDPENPASARVLRKAGFIPDSALSTPDAAFFVRDLD